MCKLILIINTEMVTTVHSVMLLGVDVINIDVEVDISPGLSDFTIVGLASKEILESKKRIYSAIINAGFVMPKSRIVINLAPADLIKNSTGLDFPIAVGILVGTQQIKLDTRNKVFWGELSLTGDLQNTKGVSAITLSSHVECKSGLYIPAITANQALIDRDAKVYLVNNLRDITAPVAGKYNNIYANNARKDDENFRIVYNEKLVMGIIYSIVGRHNILAVGPAGVGKSYALRLIEKLSPPMSQGDFYEVNRIYSIAGLNKDAMVYYPPFRSPHHSITAVSFIGGGTKFRVGEMTLAHKGFLLLDEFNLFNKHILDSMREPMECKYISIQRNGYSYNLPCDFTLLATMNPCACGNYGSELTKCKCSLMEREKYWKKVSQPILDRIDMQVFVDNTMLEEKLGRKYITLKEIWNMIGLAIGFKRSRGEYMGIKSDIHQLVENAAKKYNLSLRGANKVLALARTIADVGESREVKEWHVSEALSYRIMSSLS